jgi:hypothetical protein
MGSSSVDKDLGREITYGKNESIREALLSTPVGTLTPYPIICSFRVKIPHRDVCNND